MCWQFIISCEPYYGGFFFKKLPTVFIYIYIFFFLFDRPSVLQDSRPDRGYQGRGGAGGGNTQRAHEAGGTRPQPGHEVSSYIKDGAVQEEGTHNELMKLEGLYHSLVMRSVSTPVFTICISNSQPGFLYVF